MGLSGLGLTFPQGPVFWADKLKVNEHETQGCIVLLWFCRFHVGPAWEPSPPLVTLAPAKRAGRSGTLKPVEGSVRARNVRRLPLLRGVPQLSVRHGRDMVGATAGLSCHSCLRGQPWGRGVCGQRGPCRALDVHRFVEPVSAQTDASATGHSGVCQEESLAFGTAGGHRPLIPPPCCPCGLTEIVLFTEAKNDQAGDPKEPPQSVRFAFEEGCAGHCPKGPSRASLGSVGMWSGASVSSQQGWDLVPCLNEGGRLMLWEEPGLGVSNQILGPILLCSRHGTLAWSFLFL